MPTLGTSFIDPAVDRRVSDGLDRVEALLASQVDSSEPLVAEAASHLLNAGGKRFRPLLTLLAAEFGDPTAADIVPAAVVVELTHLATLYHDDVMDEADLRRGAPSANARWDNSVAILVGDFLFARASELVADLGVEAVRIQARTFARLVHGQIAETIGPREGESRLDHYLQVVSDKTGSLIATSALFGAKTAGADASVQQALLAFGERIGTVFQLADDLIDLTSETQDSGKTPGTDLREGVPTLPTLFAQRANRPEDARLLHLLSGPIEADAEVDEALALLRAHPAIEEARAHVRGEAEAARQILDGLPDVPARAALAELCDRVVTRLA